jgi:hypothetical protein
MKYILKNFEPIYRECSEHYVIVFKTLKSDCVNNISWNTTIKTTITTIITNIILFHCTL